MKVSEKIWGGRNSDEILSKRFKLFVLLGAIFAGLFWVFRAVVGIELLPNFELFIPTLVVVGSFSLPTGRNRFWRALNRYFGVVALLSAVIFDLALFWSPRWTTVFVFKWSGFIFAWLLGMRNKLSMFDRFKTLLGTTLLTTAIAIILFDFWTGVIGWGLWSGSFWLALIGQIPFTFYHLTSLVFVPPLVGLGKLLVKVKVPVQVAVRAGTGVEARG